jgi:phosphoribosylanthranilate isomerase
VDLERAAELCALLPPFVAAVAVLRHPSPAEVARAVERVRPALVQSEPVAGIAEALGPGVGLLSVYHDSDDLLARAERGTGRPLLLEARGPGGRGVAPDWGRAAALAARVPLVLAGGLTPENVGGAIRRVRPFAVDVSSGVERAPGVKDPERIRRFLDAVRAASADLEREPGR